MQPSRSENDLLQLRRRVRAYRDSIVDSLQTLVTYASINSGSSDGISDETRGALRCILDHAGRLGLTARNLDNLAGYVELGPPDVDETVGVLAHLDVVPPGEGWTHEPFAGVVADGLIWGRGVEDDKGPAVSALYAMKALSDLGVPLSRNVRLILGTNEEKGSWIGVKRYEELEGAPTLGFTPDGDFPVICGEKGIMNVTLRVASREPAHAGRYSIVGWRAGMAPNVVPALAWAALSIDGGEVAAAIGEWNVVAAQYQSEHPASRLKVLDHAEFAYQYPKECRPACDLGLVAEGNESHGAMPWDGHNAMLDLAGVLARLDITDNAHGVLARFIAEQLGTEWDGTGLGLAATDERLGPTTVNLGVARTAGRAASIVLNILPTPPHTISSIAEMLKRQGEPAGIAVAPDYATAMEPLFVDETEPLVAALKSAYAEVTGEPAECRYIGGTTHAKAFPHMVAFGPMMPGEPMLAHQVDERVTIDSFVRNAEIYAVALYRLTG